MDEEEIIKRKKLEELQRRMMERQVESEIARKEMIERAKREILAKILDKKAFERLGAIRIGKPELAAQLEAYLISLYERGAIKAKITDEKLKSFLNSIIKKRDFRITRR